MNPEHKGSKRVSRRKFLFNAAEKAGEASGIAICLAALEARIVEAKESPKHTRVDTNLVALKNSDPGLQSLIEKIQGQAGSGFNDSTPALAFISVADSIMEHICQRSGENNNAHNGNAQEAAKRIINDTPEQIRQATKGLGVEFTDAARTQIKRIILLVEYQTGKGVAFFINNPDSLIPGGKPGTAFRTKLDDILANFACAPNCQVMTGVEIVTDIPAALLVIDAVKDLLKLPFTPPENCQTTNKTPAPEEPVVVPAKAPEKEMAPKTQTEFNLTVPVEVAVALAALVVLAGGGVAATKSASA